MKRFFWYVLVVQSYLCAMHDNSRIGIDTLPRDCQNLVLIKDITSSSSVDTAIESIKKLRLVNKQFKDIVSDKYVLQEVARKLSIPDITVAKHIRSIPGAASIMKEWLDDIRQKIDSQFSNGVSEYSTYKLCDSKCDCSNLSDCNMVNLVELISIDKERPKGFVLLKQGIDKRLFTTFGCPSTVPFLSVTPGKGMIFWLQTVKGRMPFFSMKVDSHIRIEFRNEQVEKNIYSFIRR